MTERADVIVIGLGPGGEDAAGRLAEAGLDVVGIEAALVGGECPYWGCIPSKMIIRGANLLAEARRVAGMAGAADVHPDFAQVAERIRSEATDTWDDTVAADRFTGKGGRLVRGRGRLVGPGQVAVGDEVYEASRAVIIAAGATPWAPPIEGLAGTPYWTNREAIEAEEVPTSLAVLGGGAIGVELAQAFGRFGAQVTVLEVAPSLVGPEEPEAARVLEDVLTAEGIDVRTGVTIASVAHDGGGFRVELAAGAPVTAERLLVAVGRRPDLASLGVAAIGVDEGARALPVDEHLRVLGAERTWAIGDITGKGAFTHLSMYQANIVVHDVLGDADVRADYRAVPRVTFTDPEIGSVGLTERDARAAGLTVRTALTPISASTRGWIHGPGNEGLIKLVEDEDRGVLVGATSMGPWGGEVLGLLSLAVAAEVPTETLRRMIYAYPTFHRAIQAAVDELSA
jgi:pyruvate/2-oxoglutarate dehydrogenase complex dihydrolipoamide dehydrogenase (E3) component